LNAKKTLGNFPLYPASEKNLALLRNLDTKVDINDYIKQQLPQLHKSIAKSTISKLLIFWFDNVMM
jgi:hypothetical protein